MSERINRFCTDLSSSDTHWIERDTLNWPSPASAIAAKADKAANVANIYEYIAGCTVLWCVYLAV